mmetsp:Transcript_82552/g.257746  ORF Transcript_82552/g.257746 Transcript_82552/m.257746 type:complete len:209 (-) Transcript_82552:395-1021(-)
MARVAGPHCLRRSRPTAARSGPWAWRPSAPASAAVRRPSGQQQRLRQLLPPRALAARRLRRPPSADCLHRQAPRKCPAADPVGHLAGPCPPRGPPPAAARSDQQVCCSSAAAAAVATGRTSGRRRCPLASYSPWPGRPPAGPAAPWAAPARGAGGPRAALGRMPGLATGRAARRASHQGRRRLGRAPPRRGPRACHRGRPIGRQGQGR